MYFVILGAGEVGLRVAQILSNEGHEVVLVEKEKRRVAHIYNKIDCKVLIDDGARTEVFYDAGIEEADYFIAATGHDEINLITSLLVQKIAPHVKTIARLRGQGYVTNTDGSVFSINHVVHPEREAALSIIKSIEIGGGASNVFTFDNFGDVMGRNFFIDSDSNFIDVALKNVTAVLEIPSNLKSKFLIIFINRKGESIIPSGDFVFQEGDEIFFLGSQKILEELLEHLGKKVRTARSIKNIMILGVGAVTDQLVDCYYNTSNNSIFSTTGKRRVTARDITVIDDDLAKCEEFADLHPEVTVLHADVTEEDIMEDLEISQVDMLIANTPLQERNIVLAAHSHNLGVPNTIAIVRTPVYFSIAAELGINVSLSVRSAVVSSIIRILRGQGSLYSLAEGSFEIIECDVAPESAVVYKPISGIVLPPKCLIMCVSNDKQQGTISHGNTVICPNDRLLCIAHPDSIDKLNNLFTPAKEKEKEELEQENQNDKEN